jgi:hypothetical protein
MSSCHGPGQNNNLFQKRERKYIVSDTKLWSFDIGGHLGLKLPSWIWQKIFSFMKYVGIKNSKVSRTNLNIAAILETYELNFANFFLHFEALSQIQNVKKLNTLFEVMLLRYNDFLLNFLVFFKISKFEFLSSRNIYVNLSMTKIAKLLKFWLKNGHSCHQFYESQNILRTFSKIDRIQNIIHIW